MRSTLLALGALALATPAAAQQRWGTPLAGKAEFSLIWDRPTFDDSDGLGTTVGIWTLGARFRVNEKLNLVLAVPQLRAPVDGDFGSETTIGNPYLGLETVGERGRPEFSLGLRIGQVDQDAFGPGIVGLYTDWERFEQAIPEALSLRASAEQRPWDDGAGAFVAVKVGATLVHSTNADAADPNDFFFDYGFRFGREMPAAAFGIGVSGRWWLSSDGQSLSEATINNAFADVTLGAGQARPMIGVRVPLDDEFKEVVKYVLVFGVTVGLE